MSQATEHRGKPNFFDIDFAVSPFIAIWEITRACDLRCVHCRAEAIPNRDPLELTTEQGLKLIEDISSFSQTAKPLFVITGGDPIKRPDVYDFIRHADKVGLRCAVTPSATGLLTREAIHKMKVAGLTRMAISLDGSTKEIHDNFRRQPGSYDHTLRAIKDAIAEGLTVQINTTISRWNLNDIDNLCALMQGLGLTLWSAFFLVPTGRGEEKDEISPEQYEQVLEKLYQTAKKAQFDFKATSAPHYRRIVLQHQREEGRAADSMRFVPPNASYGSDGKIGGPAEATGKDAPPPWVLRPMLPGAWSRGDAMGRAARGVNDGNGFIFIDHHGEVYPSGLPAAEVRQREEAEHRRDLPEASGPRAHARFRAAQGQVFCLRLPRCLRRGALSGLCRHGRLHGQRALLHLRAALAGARSGRGLALTQDACGRRQADDEDVI
jgi:MoaA/NifB/PqqE/SkfB family radical SAM enzyme